VAVLVTKQGRAMQWGVASFVNLCGRALSKFVRQGRALDRALPGDSVSRHWDE
jgi:hypothetical protein